MHISALKELQTMRLDPMTSSLTITMMPSKLWILVHILYVDKPLIIVLQMCGYLICMMWACREGRNARQVKQWGIRSEHNFRCTGAEREREREKLKTYGYLCRNSGLGKLLVSPCPLLGWNLPLTPTYSRLFVRFLHYLFIYTCPCLAICYVCIYVRQWYWFFFPFSPRECIVWSKNTIIFLIIFNLRSPFFQSSYTLISFFPLIR